MSIRKEYLETIFVAKTPKEGWPRRFYIVTPCNPFSGGDRDGDDGAYRNFRKELSRRGHWRHKVTGASPDWGHREVGCAVGRISLGEAIKLGKEFKQNAIFGVEGDEVRVVSCLTRESQAMGRFSERLFKWSNEPKFRIYVVLLNKKVLEKSRFRKANPDYRDGLPCYYVGMTGLTPDQRFANHKAGHQCCPYVRDFGEELARDKFESIPPLSRADAEAREPEHAEFLRSQGYGVWPDFRPAEKRRSKRRRKKKKNMSKK